MTSLIRILSFLINESDTAACLITLGFWAIGSFLTTGELLLLLYDGLPLYHPQLLVFPCCGFGLYCPCQKLIFAPPHDHDAGALLGVLFPPVLVRVLLRVAGSELRITTAFFFAI